MEHISLLELVARSFQDVFPREVRRIVNRSHYILKLVPETKCTAGLVKGAPAP